MYMYIYTCMGSSDPFSSSSPHLLDNKELIPSFSPLLSTYPQFLPGSNLLLFLFLFLLLLKLLL